MSGRTLLQPRVVSELDPLVAPRPGREVERDHGEDELQPVRGDGGDGAQGVLTPNRSLLKFQIEKQTMYFREALKKIYGTFV